MDKEHDALQRIHAADLIFAELRGGKLDGKFIPLWLGDRVASSFTESAAGRVLNASVFRIVIVEAAAAEILRDKVTAVKGRSAAWPMGLIIQTGRNGNYEAKFVKQ